MSMFCYQCEQTAHGTGCTNFGICGKDPDTAALQDLVVYVAKGISSYAHLCRQRGITDDHIDKLTLEAMFATVTNVDFDPLRLQELLSRQSHAMENIKAKYLAACDNAGKKPVELDGPANWVPAKKLVDLVDQGVDVSIRQRKEQLGEDIVGLQELILYGVKGLAAYAHHASVLGFEDDSVFAFIHNALNFLNQDDTAIEDLLAMALKTGEVNLTVLALLDQANTETFGTPEPTQIRIHPVKGKAILVSGHDMKDLEEILKQTEGKGINVYTHGEMMPALAYPAFKKYKHLVGNYGGAWMDQRREFRHFPGAIIMTTNCIQQPRETYIKRIFTRGFVAWPGVKHLNGQDYSLAIECALEQEGFLEDGPDSTITIGFAHQTVLGVADKVIDAVKEGHLKHFFLIGGCDGAESVRNYFTDLAEQVPDDCAILTLGCGKYRFNKLPFGDIGGIPRLLDMGQCNDAYSAIKVAVALAEAFDTDVNSLPLSLVLSWFEQKAVCILLTLLHLGITDIRLGPALPAFVTPTILNVLVEKFNIKPIGAVDRDLKEMLGEPLTA